jgi:hypothetical protein
MITVLRQRVNQTGAVEMKASRVGAAAENLYFEMVVVLEFRLISEAGLRA